MALQIDSGARLRQSDGVGLDKETSEIDHGGSIQ